MSIKTAVVLFSGKGSNLENLLRNKSDLDNKLIYKAAFTNNSSAGGVNICKKYALSVSIADDSDINASLLSFLKLHNPDLIILSGYMKILPIKITERYKGKIINIHPSLLPKYPGLNTHKKVISNKDKLHGASVHFVNEKMDEGPVIIQGIFKVNNETDSIKLKNNVHKVEYIIFPIAIRWFALDILKLEDDSVSVNGIKITKPIQYFIDDHNT